MKKLIRINFNRVKLLSQEIRRHLNFSKIVHKISLPQQGMLSYKLLQVPILLTALISMVIFFTFKKNQINTTSNSAKTKFSLNKYAEPADLFRIDASKAETLHYKSGTQIVIPANSFVDDKGKIITGKVDILYHEFNTPKDILFSEISMNYDSAGLNYQFESAGMLEINGWQNNKPVFIKAEKNLQVHMASTVTKPGINLYVFDTLKNNWFELGKDSVNNYLAEEAEKYFSSTPIKSENDSLSLMAKDFIAKKQAEEKLSKIAPIKPVLANNNKANFTIDFNKEDFKELCAFENVKFEICDSTIDINPNDANTIWENVSLTRAKNNCYDVKFWTSTKSLQHRVNPVFEASEIGKANQIFENKFALYQKTLHQKIVEKEIAAKKLAEQLIIAQKQAALEREKEIKEQEEKNKAEEKRMNEALKEEMRIREVEMKEQMAKWNEQQKKLMEMAAAVNSVTRSFYINRFGVYNSDRIMKNLNDIPLLVNLNKESNSTIIELYVVIKGIRTAIHCYPIFKRENEYNLKYSNDEEFKIIAITTSKKIATADHKMIQEALKNKNSGIELEILSIDLNNQDELNKVINF
ncbi:MAG TPA: hypothetical protein PK323_14040 [Bacteroidia bacterium]|nr:hypothetical protein [Bacteroidia bacterium]